MRLQLSDQGASGSRPGASFSRMRLQFVIRNVEANKIDFYTYDAFEIRALCLPASSQ